MPQTQATSHSVQVKTPRLSPLALKSIARALTSKEFWVPSLDPILKERIVLRVSRVNDCAVCSSLHTRRATRLGLSSDEVRAAQEAHETAFDEKTQAALRYAELRTRGDDNPEARSMFEKLYTTEERAAIDSVIDTFTFNNRFNNTWETLLPGAAKRRER